MIIKNKHETDQQAISRVQKWKRRMRILRFKPAMKNNPIPTRILKFSKAKKIQKQMDSDHQSRINSQFPWFKKYQDNLSSEAK